jgi:ABC-type multidrug transport system fused ATPase/permease subunit
MLIVTHRISTVQNCDKIIEIENGKIKSIKKRK